MSHPGRHVHECDDGAFVISEDHCWRPGAYATREAAELAFEFCDDELARVRDAVNEEGCPITLENLSAHEPRVCAGCARWRR